MKSLRCRIGLHRWSTWRYNKTLQTYYHYCLRPQCHKRQYGTVEKAVNEMVRSVLGHR